MAPQPETAAPTRTIEVVCAPQRLHPDQPAGVRPPPLVPAVTNRAYGESLTTRSVHAIAPQFAALSRLFAVFAAELAISAVLRD